MATLKLQVVTGAARNKDYNVTMFRLQDILNQGADNILIKFDKYLDDDDILKYAEQITNNPDEFPQMSEDEADASVAGYDDESVWEVTEFFGN